MIHNILNMRAAVTYVPYQDLENKQMLSDFLNSPNDFVNHIRRYSNSLTTQMVFGFRTPDNNDPKLRQLFDVGSPPWRYGNANAHLTIGIRKVGRSCPRS